MSGNSRASRAVQICLLISLAACGNGSPAAPEPQQETSTKAAIRPIPLEDGPPLEPGTYLISSAGRTGSDPAQWSIIDFTITIPEGWNGHTGHYLSKFEDVEGAENRSIGFYPVLVDAVFADPCEGERGPTVAVGNTVSDLVDALLAQPGDVAAEPVETTIGGLPAVRVNLQIPDRADLRSCHLAEFGPPGLQIWFSDPSDKYLVVMPGSTTSVYVVDVEGQRQVFVTGHATAAPDDVLDELRSILDSIRIL